MLWLRTIYFKEPYRTNMTEWTQEHLDFDALVSSVDFDEDIAVVIAYSKDSEKPVILPIILILSTFL